MSQTAQKQTAKKPKRVNLRTPEVMSIVKDQVETHYRSVVVDYIRYSGNHLQAGGLTVKLAKAFGFCYGVERAIDLAYAASRYFGTEKKIFLIGEIIHNPEVNEQLSNMGIVSIMESKDGSYDFSEITENDVIIIPAFGAPCPRNGQD